MKKFFLLLLILAPASAIVSQTAFEAGKDCFDRGDYSCAKAKYQEAINETTGMDNQIAQLEYGRAEACEQNMSSADSAFMDENYQVAKENYLMVLNENPNDSYAESQIDKCNAAIEAAITLSVSRSNISLSPAGGSQRVFVNTNAESYSISEFPFWCTIEAENNYFDISYQANTNENSRTGRFKITAGKKEVYVNVTQAPKPKIETTLSVSEDDITIKSDGRRIVIDVSTSSSDYEIAEIPSWCEIYTKATKYFVLECKRNTSRSSRSGTITVTAEDKNVEINVQQLGAIKLKKDRESISYKPKTAAYRFFAIGYEGGQVAKYGIRMEFGGRKFVGMFLNVRSTLISDSELLQNFGSLENKNEAVIGLNLRMSRVVYFNIGGGYGYYKIAQTLESLEQIEYYPVYAGLTFRLGRRVNFSVGASFLDIEQSIDTSDFDPEFTLGLTINVLR